MFPRWLSWLFILFLGYIIITGNRGAMQREAAPEKALREDTIEQDYPKLHAFIDGERWKKAIKPDYTPEANPCAPVAAAEGYASNYAILETRGSGSAAKCGDTIRLNIIAHDIHGKAAEPTTETLTLGDQPGLDALLVGMMTGETRTLIITPPKDGYNALPALKANALQVIAITRLTNKAEE